MTPSRYSPVIHSSDGTLVALSRQAAQVYPDRDAYVEVGRRITYAGYDVAADGVATLLREKGVMKGDVVCLAIPNSIEYAVAYQAAIRLGAITSGVSTRLGPRESQSIVDKLRPKVIVVAEPGQAPANAGLVVALDELSQAFDRDPAYGEPHIGPSDPVTVVWTSGTTGDPKGAVFDHTRMEAMARGGWPLTAPRDRRLFPVPFAHTGYMTRLWDEISNAITSVLTPPEWTAAAALYLIDREAITVGQGVPTQWALMLRHERFEDTDFSHMRIAGVGAARIPPELVLEIRDRIGCPVVVRYTSTEACITTSTSPEDGPEVVAQTVGKPVDGVEMKLVDDNGKSVPDGEVGQVSCRSAAVFKEYWEDPEHTSEVFDEDGWLRTGDLGFLDQDRNLRIVGRQSEMYIRGGYNVYPLQIEELLAEHPAVADVAVVGYPDPVLGEIGVAFVVKAQSASDRDLTGDALRDWCVRFVADYKAPDRVLLVEEIPRNALGKADRRLLLEMVHELVASPGPGSASAP
jgi:acyl-CoA synthetase (AMP-forming)/AMP-acid ligase II